METFGLEKLGIINPSAVYRNLSPAQLTEHALRRGEGTLSNTGALVVKTGKYTGRSANDKFIVDSEGVHDDIAWGKVNKPISQADFASDLFQSQEFLLQLNPLPQSNQSYLWHLLPVHFHSFLPALFSKTVPRHWLLKFQ